MRKLIHILLIVLYAAAANAQLAPQFTFTHYSTSTGLLSNQVNAVAQDENGYIWIATTDGLVRFDGTRYKVFRHRNNDPSSIAGNVIWNLLMDKEKNLWILTADGHAGRFNTKNFTFSEARIRCRNESALKTGSKRMVADEEGNIFLVIGANEILTWDEHKNNFALENNFFPSPEGWGFTAFAQQPGTQKYWMAVQGGGIAIYNRATGHLNYDSSNADHEPAVDRYKKAGIPTNFLFDKKGRVWFAVWGPGFPYIYCYDTKTQQPVLEKYEFFSVLHAYHEIGTFFEQQDGTIWTTGLKVFAHFDEKEKKFIMIPAGYTNERSIDYRQISSLYEDREHNIWTGTGNNGLFRFNPSETYFTNVGHLRKTTGTPGDGNPLCFIKDKDGSLLTGIWGESLYRYDSNFNVIPLNIKTAGDSNFNAIWCMYPSRDSNTVWMTAQPGIYAYDQKKHTAEYYNPAILGNYTVRQVAEDKHGNLWLGLQHVGVFKWNVIAGRSAFEAGLSKFTSIPEAQINFISIDRKGYVWICTRGAGLYVVDPDTDSIVQHFHKTAAAELQLPEDEVTALLDYSDSIVVIGTTAHVQFYNRVLKKSTAFRSDAFSGFIRSMQKDKAGNIWISTTSALYRIRINSRILLSYNRDDGITSDYFVLASSYAMPDGRLIFGAAGQFTVFDPLHIGHNNPMNPGNVSITDFKVMNKSLLVDSLMHLEQVALGYDQNSLVIEFSQLSFSGALLIQYRMEGLDKEWNTPDKSNQAVYSYLPPGTYRLFFRTVDTEGNTKESKSILTINITPPFWRAWWFYALLGLLASVLIYWFDREWIKRKAVVQQMRSDIAGNLHEEVNTALSNINILSEMALMKSEKEPEKSTEFIRQIHSRSHNMIIAMDDMLWSISPDNDSMDKTVDRMREYIDALRNRHQVNIELLVDANIEKLELNMFLRHEAFLLFKEGISSLVIAGVKNCAIQIGLEKNILVYTMQFSNNGCDMQQLNNLLQRRDMEKHLQAIQASLDVQVHKTNSVFILRVPV